MQRCAIGVLSMLLMVVASNATRSETDNNSKTPAPLSPAIAGQIPLAPTDAGDEQLNIDAPRETASLLLAPDAPTEREPGSDDGRSTIVAPSKATGTRFRSAPHQAPASKASEVSLQFKVFNVSKDRAVEAGIDLASIMAGEPSGVSERRVSQTNNESDSTLTIVGRRERDLLTKLLLVSGTAKLLAESTLVTVDGRKAKFHSGSELEILSPPGAEGVTTTYHDIGTKIEATPSVQNRSTVLTELRVEYSDIDDTRAVQANGVLIPHVRSRWIDLAVQLSENQTVVLGSPNYDGLLVMVTAQIAQLNGVQAQSVGPKDELQTDVVGGRSADHDRSLSVAIDANAQQLRSEVRSLRAEVRRLRDTVDERFARAPAAPSNSARQLVSTAEPVNRGNQESRAAAVSEPPQDEAVGNALHIDAELIDPEEGRVRIGDKVTIHLSVTNRGTSTLTKVRARMISENGSESLPRHSEEIFHALRRLAPGESKLLAFDFIAGQDCDVRKTLEVAAEGGHMARLLYVVPMAPSAPSQVAIPDSTDELYGSRSERELHSVSAVSFAWEASRFGHAVYTIRVGTGVLDQLQSGHAIVGTLDESDRALRKFRVVVGPAARQASYTESDATHKVNYGWRPNDKGGFDYYVQVSPEHLDHLAKGSTLMCEVHPDVESINAVYVFTGDAQLPREAAR